MRSFCIVNCFFNWWWVNKEKEESVKPVSFNDDFELGTA
jgi:hypothetical protein